MNYAITECDGSGACTQTITERVYSVPIDSLDNLRDAMTSGDALLWLVAVWLLVLHIVHRVEDHRDDWLPDPAWVAAYTWPFVLIVAAKILAVAGVVS